jgi:hypothetical protein
MARIPSIADMGPRPVPDGQRPVVSDQSGEIVAQATRQLGESLTHAGNVVYEQQVNMARAQATNALLDHEIAVKTKVEDVKKRVENGEIPYDKARSVFQTEMGAYQLPQIKSLDPVATQSYTRGVQRNMLGGNTAIQRIADAAEQIDFKDQFAKNLDNLGKLAGMPDANIEKINAQADMFAPLAQRAGIPKNLIDHAIQNFKDQNWFNQATQRSMEARTSIPALDALAHDLTDADGYYAGKLDTDKRNAILSQVLNHKNTLENRLLSDANRREAKAERAIGEIERQVSSSVPATAEMWNDWDTTIKGTPYESDFRQLQSDEREVQSVLRAPIADQVKFLQDKESALKSGGGSVRELANYNRLKGAITQNVKLLNDAPLQFNAVRTGTDVEPLDVGALVDGKEGAKIADRLSTLDSMKKQFGGVPQKVLLPQEATQLSAALSQSTPKQQSQVFAGLYNAMGPDAYKVAMQQIAPDSPVRAIAGSLAAKQAQMTTATHWFKPNEIANSGDVSATMLQGEDMLNESKADKKTDGKPKLSLYLPETTTLQADFQSQIGDVFAGRPAAAETAFQAVKAYYVGRAAQIGRIAANNKDIDSGLVKESITAALGSVVSYNGGDVLAPWGMDKSHFLDAAHTSLLAEAKRRGMTEEATRAMSNASLRNAGDGTYYVTQGRNFVTDKGQPIMITVQ